MSAAKRLNWWVIGGLSFCLVGWAIAAGTAAKTAHLYAHRSPAGFRHDVISHARDHWLSIKDAVAPPRKWSIRADPRL